jgi:hypothetical protein
MSPPPAPPPPRFPGGDGRRRPRRTHPDARELVFCLVDGHCRVRCLAAHHLHDYLLGGDGTTEGPPAFGLFGLDPLLSHSVAKPRRDTLHTKANRPGRRQALRE